MNHCFISYSNADAKDFGPQLANELEGGHPYIDTWFDKRDIASGATWDEAVPEAIKTCKCFLFVMTSDSILEKSICAEEWDLALRYKRPILILRLDSRITEAPFRLGKRQWIDFSRNQKAGMAKLRQAIQRLDSPEGQFGVLKDRLADANRDLTRVESEKDKKRIQSEIDDLKTEIKSNEIIQKDPEKAKKQTRKNINTGLERDRQPLNPISGITSSKFINPRPGSIPDYFEGRLVETEEIAEFLRNDFQRIMTINGRAGSGKTVLACRVLRQLENGQFPNELGEFKVGGIVYLSEISNYKVNVANIFSGLLQLLEPQKAGKLEELYKEAKVPVDEKIRALLAALPTEPVILLMDNFESLLNLDEGILDQELHVALTTILQSDSHHLKVLITTRELPRELNMIEAARQYIQHLDEGLLSPFAENVLRKMDKDGRAGFRDATDELLGHVREATLGYPRALEALYAILRVDRYSSVEELLVEGLPDTVVQKFVGEAFSRLDTNSQKIIQTLAIYNRPVSSAAVDFALQFHIPGINSSPILERLVSMHFVRRESKRYFLHPADRDYAISRIPKGETDKKIGQGARARTWDQRSLTLRAADYFVEVRKPRTEWKQLDDLAAQLAEFELRCEANDYDTAARIFIEFDNKYLNIWGHYRLIINLQEKIRGKVIDKWLKGYNLSSLGSAYNSVGDLQESITCFEHALELDRENKDKQGEGSDLCGLGSVYSELGDIGKSIDFYEQALVLAREIGDHRGEGTILGNLGLALSSLGDIHKSIELYKQALVSAQKFGDRNIEAGSLSNLGGAYFDLGDMPKSIEFTKQALIIYRETGNRNSEAFQTTSLAGHFLNDGQYLQAIELVKQSLSIIIDIGIPATYEYGVLSQAYLLCGQLEIALSNAKKGQIFDMPLHNYFISILLGLITLQQGDKEAAFQAFILAITQSDKILAKTPEYYDALDAKGLALCGVILAGRGDPSMPTVTNDGKTVPPDKATVNAGRVAPTVNDAIETFKKARKIAPHAGVVKSVLRLFDELVKCDEAGILKDVRNAVEGVE